MSKEETKARQLMALALGSPYAEEGRTAALAAVRIIHEQELLDRKTPEPRRTRVASVTRSRAHGARSPASAWRDRSAPIVAG